MEVSKIVNIYNTIHTNLAVLAGNKTDLTLPSPAISLLPGSSLIFQPNFDGVVCSSISVVLQGGSSMFALFLNAKSSSRRSISYPPLMLGSLPDSHCHLNVDCTSATVSKLATKINSLDVPRSFFHLMSTCHLDLALIDELLDELDGPSVVPYFGVHPWYSHLFTLKDYTNVSEEDQKLDHYHRILTPAPPEELFSNLPAPINIHEHIKKIESLIAKHEGKFDYGIGEIGLDKLIRVPTSGFFGSTAQIQGRQLSLCKIHLHHQIDIFQTQLALAEKMKKQISIHCVKAPGLLYEAVIKNRNIPAVILHSYSGSIEQAKIWIRHYEENTQAKLYFSLSQCINGVDHRRELLRGILKSTAHENLLIESDMPLDKLLLETPDDYFGQLSSIYAHLSEQKGSFPVYENMMQSIAAIE